MGGQGQVIQPEDPRLQKLDGGDLRALAVEVSQQERDRMTLAAQFGIPFLPRIDRWTFIRFLCTKCGHDFSVRADTAITGRGRCPSRQCQGPVL